MHDAQSELQAVGSASAANIDSAIEALKQGRNLTAERQKLLIKIVELQTSLFNF